MIKNADLKEMKELLEKDIRLQYIAVRSDESRRYIVEICHFPAAPYVFGLCVQLSGYTYNRFDFSAAALMQSITAALMPPLSRASHPSIVVPPGEVTISFNCPG